MKSLTEQFNHDYLQNNQWLNTTRLENPKLLNTESVEKYISDMSDLALLVGIGEEELSKSLKRGLPAKLRWHVDEFQPYYVVVKQYNVYYWGEANYYHLMTMHILMW